MVNESGFLIILLKKYFPSLKSISSDQSKNYLPSRFSASLCGFFGFAAGNFITSKTLIPFHVAD
jgi:hypothetical protein